MPSKEKRKVLSVGDSIAVTLPKPFADYHSLKSGDSVQVIYDGLYLVFPPGSENKLKERRKLIDELLR